MTAPLHYLRPGCTGHDLIETQRQPREQAVSCWACGRDSRGRTTQTWRLSGLCATHESAVRR